jgi:hypothetical protein
VITPPVSRKIVILEMSIGQSETFWLNYCPGVWILDLAGVWATVNDAGLRASLPAAQSISIISVYSDATPLLSVPAAIGPLSVSTVQNSYFLDTAHSFLYVSTASFNSPAIHNIKVGVVVGFANQAGVWNGYIYEGRIKEAPSIQKTKDPTFFGKVSFDSGDVVLENTDGALDTLYSSSLGYYASLKVAIDPQSYNDFFPVYSGYVQDVDMTEQTVKVTIKDLRQNSSASGVGYYQYAKSNVGKLIPVGYGTMYNVPCLAVNDNQSGSPNWTFVMLDTAKAPMQSVSAVYFTDSNGKKNTLTLTSQYTVSLTAGTITIINGTSVGGQTITGASKISCDCIGLGFLAANVAAIKSYNAGYSGTDYSNGVSIINELMYSYGGSGFLFSAQTFNQLEWEVARSQAKNVGIYVDNASDIITQIQLILATLNTCLIVTDGGLYTLRKFSLSRASSQYFKVEDDMDYISITNSIELSITSTMVGYARDWMNKSYSYLHDTSFQALNSAAFHKLLEPSEYDTLLSDNTGADAQAFSNDIGALLGIIDSRVTFKTKFQALDVEIMDFIDVDVNRPSKAMLGKCQLEVIDVTKDLTNFETTIVGRLVQIYPSGTSSISVGSYYGDAIFSDRTFGITGT